MNHKFDRYFGVFYLMKNETQELWREQTEVNFLCDELYVSFILFHSFCGLLFFRSLISWEKSSTLRSQKNVLIYI